MLHEGEIAVDWTVVWTVASFIFMIALFGREVLWEMVVPNEVFEEDLHGRGRGRGQGEGEGRECRRLGSAATEGGDGGEEDEGSVGSSVRSSESSGSGSFGDGGGDGRREGGCRERRVAADIDWDAF